jgi:hypothetical protein
MPFHNGMARDGVATAGRCFLFAVLGLGASGLGSADSLPEGLCSSQAEAVSIQPVN